MSEINDIVEITLQISNNYIDLKLKDFLNDHTVTLDGNKPCVIHIVEKCPLYRSGVMRKCAKKLKND